MNTQNLNSGFVAGTLVHTDKGLVPIQDVKVADIVLSRPEWGGEFSYKKVATTFTSLSEKLMLVTYISEKQFINKTDIEPILSYFFVTSGHVIWTNEKEWLEIDDIQEGNSFLLADGSHGIIMSNPISVKKSFYKGFGYCEAWHGTYLIDFKNNKNDSLRIVQVVENSSIVQYKTDYDNYQIYYEADINKLEICDISLNEVIKEIYHFKVEDYHTYFVGELGLWVHDQST